MEKVRVHVSALDAIAAHAGQSYPREACGLLYGERENDEYIIGSIKALENSEIRNGHRRFSIAPDRLLQEHKAARRTNKRIIGHYHSHPNGRSTPSQTDIASITDPGALWLIQSVKNGDPDTLHAYYPSEEKSGFKALEVIVLKD